MDASIATSLVPFLIGLAVSGLGVYLTMKYRGRGRLDVVIRRYLPLFDEITRDLPELELYYMGSPISRHLILVEGFVRNSGYLDISREDVKKPLSIIVPPDYVVREVPRIEGAGYLHVTQEGITIDIDFLKADEALPFKFLLEAGDRYEAQNRSQTYIEKEADSANRFMYASKLVAGIKNTKITTRTLIGTSGEPLSRSSYYVTLLLSFFVVLTLTILSTMVTFRATFTDLMVEEDSGAWMAGLRPTESGDAIVLYKAEDSLFDADVFLWFATLDVDREDFFSIPIGDANELLERNIGLRIITFEEDGEARALARALMWIGAAAAAGLYWIVFVRLHVIRHFSERVREWSLLRRVRARTS